GSTQGRGNLVVPAHQAPPGESDGPRAAEAEGRLLSSSDLERESNTPGTAASVRDAAVHELPVLVRRPTRPVGRPARQSTGQRPGSLRSGGIGSRSPSGSPDAQFRSAGRS